MDYLHKIENQISDLGFNIISKDFERPWGGFLIIDETESKLFANYFFNKKITNKIDYTRKISPKILIIKPNSKLSWQYHIRRTELWQVYKNKIGVIKSKTDSKNKMKIYNEGECVEIKKEERHRIIGMENYAIVAEIWQHKYSDMPSDEKDIIRIDDEYGRE